MVNEILHDSTNMQKVSREVNSSLAHGISTFMALGVKLTYLTQWEDYVGKGYIGKLLHFGIPAAIIIQECKRDDIFRPSLMLLSLL